MRDLFLSITPPPPRSTLFPYTTLFRSIRVWFVVPDPPLIRRSLGIALRRVLPLFLAPERSDVEVVPGAPHLLVAAIVDEVGSEHAVALVDERVGTVPFIHAEVLVEAVRNCVPRDELPAHSCLQTFDVLL